MGCTVKRELASTAEIPENATVCIYGAGLSGHVLLERINKKRPDIKVRCFLDSFKSQKLECGLDQIAFKEYLTLEKYDELIIISSAFVHEIEAALVESQIQTYSIYRPEHEEDLDTTYEAIINLWSAIREGRLHLIEGKSGVFHKKKTLLLKAIPFGETLNEPINDSTEQELISENCIVSTLNYSLCGPHLINQISVLLEQFQPEHILILGKDGDFNQTANLVTEINKITSPPIFLYRPHSPLSWRGVRIPDSNWAYVSIAKCGSSSFLHAIRETYEKGFKKGSHDAFSPNTILRNFPFPQVESNTDIFFAIVRNPYNRIASLYRFYLEGNYPLGNKLETHFDETPLSFENFCEFICTCPDDISESHFKPQHIYLRHHDGSFFVNKLFRLEELSQNIDEINNLLPIPIKLHHRNRTSKSHAVFFNEQLKNSILNRYQTDFEVLGYKP